MKDNKKPSQRYDSRALYKNAKFNLFGTENVSL